MKKWKRWSTKLAPWSACLLSLLVTGCLQSEPKNLGSRKADFTGDDTNAQELFKFNFAYLDPANTTAPFTIYIQGTANSKSGMIGACNLAGTGCVCDFLDASGTVLEQSDSTEITYDETGNYFRCEFDGSGTLAQVRIHNIANTVASSNLDVESTLTLQKIMGNDLDLNKTRYIYSYSCNYTFLQKQGTSVATGFDCSSQATPCNGGNFCLLQSRFPFYLYADTYSSNVSLKVADKLYNQGNTDKVCGLQIKQYECADAQGTPLKDFGLYAEATGIWETPVVLGPGPDLSTQTYGFAAKVSTATSQCPPGLTKKIFYRVNPVSVTNATQSNYPSDLAAAKVMDSGSAPSPFLINQIPGGNCTGSSCTLPSAGILQVSSQAYSNTSETEFCVIPGTLLP